MALRATACHALLLFATCCGSCVGALPTALRVSSTAADDFVISYALGEYEADGEVNGATRYKRLATAQPQAGDRYFFLASTGRWSIVNSQADAVASKKIKIMSSESSSATPLGLSYRFYSGEGKWEADSSFAVVDISREFEKRKISHVALQAELAREKEAAKADRAWYEAELAQSQKAAAEQKAAEEQKLFEEARTKAAAEQAWINEEESYRSSVDAGLRQARDKRVAEIKAGKAARKAAAKLAAKEAAAEKTAAVAEAAAVEAAREAEAAAAVAEIARFEAAAVAFAAQERAKEEDRLAAAAAAEAERERERLAVDAAVWVAAEEALRRRRADEAAAEADQARERLAMELAAAEAAADEAAADEAAAEAAADEAAAEAAADEVAAEADQARERLAVELAAAEVAADEAEEAAGAGEALALLKEAARLEAAVSRKASEAEATAAASEALAAQRVGVMVGRPGAVPTIAEARGGSGSASGGGGGGEGGRSSSERAAEQALVARLAARKASAFLADPSEWAAAAGRVAERLAVKEAALAALAEEASAFEASYAAAETKAAAVTEARAAVFAAEAAAEEEGSDASDGGAGAGQCVPPVSLYLGSSAQGGAAAVAAVVQEATGDYVRDGDAHGYPRFRLLAPAAGPRFLFRSDKGRWSVAGSEENVARSKGTIVSLKVAESPVGLGYRYYAGNNKWPKDPSLVVVDTSPPAFEEEPDLPDDDVDE